MIGRLKPGVTITQAQANIEAIATQFQQENQNIYLLGGTGLLINSFVRVLRGQPGFNPDGVVIAQTALPAPRYRITEQRKNMQKQWWRSGLNEVEARTIAALAGAHGSNHR